MKRKILLILFMILAIFLSGCWDMEEINQRLFVSSIGVDSNPESKIQRYIVTYVYPNINSIGKNANEKTKKFVLTIPSDSVFQAGREFSVQVQYPFYYKHLKVLVIGEDLAKQGNLVKKTMDGLNRDTKINSKVQILVAEGTAKDVLKATPPQDQITDGTIYNILKDNRSASRFTPSTLNETIRDIDTAGVTIVPRISVKGNEIKIFGGAILKNYEFIGWISQVQNRAISLINNDTKVELIDAPYKDTMISYKISNSKSKKKISAGETINVDIFLRTEGYLQEYILEEHLTDYSDETLREMEKAIEKKLKREIEETIDLIQHTYNADIIGIGEHLSKFQPKVWEDIKDKWDHIFPEVQFNVKVDVKMKRTGLTK